jgi:Transposase IS116/IS110/IS902 family
MKAIHAGQAQHDTIDAQNSALLRRGGMRPQAAVDPAERRATRDVRRRRLHLARQRGALLAPGQQTNSPENLPALGQTLADQAHRDGGADRVADPAVPQRIAIALALIGDEEAWLRARALAIVKAARHQDANTRYLLRTVPSIGPMLSRVWRDDIRAMERCPRVQAFASDGRLVPCAKASAGTRHGPSGTTSGQAHRTWACSEAAV